eukprot:gene5933-11969_t
MARISPSNNCKCVFASTVLILVIELFLVKALTVASLHESYNITRNVPTFCVDTLTLKIFSKRVSSCSSLTSSSSTWTALHELQHLYRSSAREYQRAHELLAYYWFVEEIHNPYRRPCSEADLEYIPLLPFHWHARNIPLNDTISHCSYKALINDIIQYVEYSKTRTFQHGHVPRRFIVASTFNLRTMMGSGLPIQIRAGKIYETVTSFVTNVMIAHYERWPQCPDILRKGWKGHIVELPYIPIDIIDNNEDISTTLPNNNNDNNNIQKSNDFIHKKRPINFLFSGRLLLFGHERVCSVRNAIASLSVHWFTFAYSWIIPYEQFVIRLNEEDFLKNPNESLDSILRRKGSEENLQNMRSILWKWKDLLRFDRILINSNITQNLQKLYLSPQLYTDKSYRIDKRAITILPLELMLIELNAAYDPEYAIQKGLACKSPTDCASHNVYPLEFKNNALPDLRSHLCKKVKHMIGMYKMVYFMRCVRILWPITPNNLRPHDTARMPIEDRVFVREFFNINRTVGWSMTTYPLNSGDKKFAAAEFGGSGNDLEQPTRVAWKVDKDMNAFDGFRIRIGFDNDRNGIGVET